MAWDYTDKTKQLFLDAVQGKPGTHIGEIENPDGLGEYGSITCGDAIRFTFRVEKHPSDPTQDVITEAKYLTFGCTSAIASSEALCDLIEQKRLTPIEALKISNRDIDSYLGGLPQEKLHCSVMGAEALEAAVFNWSQNRGVDLEKMGVVIHKQDDDESRIVCHCFTLTEDYLKRKIRELNLKTLDELTNAVKAGGACQHCRYAPGGLQDILDDVWGNESEELQSSGGIQSNEQSKKEELSPYQLAKKIESVVDRNIRPSLQKDGGDLEIIDIKDNKVYVELKGACSTCASGGFTLKYSVENELKELVDESIKVISIKENP